MSRKVVISLAVVVGIILGALLIIVFIQHDTMKQMVAQMEVEKSELQDEYEELVIQFDDYQKIDIRNDSLQTLLSQEQGRVQDLLEELRITKATNAKRIAELKKELATVRAIMMTYVEQIDSLNRTNTKLTRENKKIRQQNIRMRVQNTELVSRNTELQETVTRASRLEISDFSHIALNKSNHKTKLLKQIKKIQFDVTIVKNITAPRGNKIIFVRVVDPKGNLIQSTPPDMFLYESDSIPYTTRQEFDFDGDEKQLSVYWTLNTEPNAGFYNVDFFIDGEIAGSYPFQLNKY